LPPSAPAVRSLHPRSDGFPDATQSRQQGPPVAAQTGHTPPSVGSGVGGGVATGVVGVGAGVVGTGGVEVGEEVVGPHSAHQHTFPPLPHPSLVFSLKHAPPNPATRPSAQIVSGRGSLLAQTCLSSAWTGFVGTGVGFADGGEVGGDVGAAVTGCPVGGDIGAAVTGCPVGGEVGAAVTGCPVGTGVGFADGWEVGGDVGVGAAVTGCPVGGDVGAAVTGGGGVGTTQILSSYDKPDPNDEQVKGSNQPMSFHVGLTDSTSPAQAYERIF